MNIIKTFFKSINYNLLLIFIYAVITFTVIFYHGLHNDEILAWNSAHAAGFKELFNNVRSQGHPYLWYILLQPFIKMGFSVFAMQILAWGFMLSAAVFFMLKSPFNLLFKTIFIFNAGMIYYYPIIARHYSLIPFFLFLLAYLYPKRHERPFIYSILIILLFQTHSYIGGFCLILSLMFIFEVLWGLIRQNALTDGVLTSGGGKSLVISAFLLVFNYLFLFFSYKPVIEAGDVAPLTRALDIKSFCSDFFNTFYTISSWITDEVHPYLILTLILIISILIFYLSKRLFIVCAGSIVSIMYLFHNIWHTGDNYNKVFIIPLIIVFCTWAMYESVQERGLFRIDSAYKILNIFVILFFTVTLISLNSYKIITNDIKYVYSDTPNIERLIAASGKEPIKIIYINTLLPIRPDNTYITLFFGGEYLDAGKFSLSEYINTKLEETGNENFSPDFIYIGTHLEFKDYQGYKKIYETEILTLPEDVLTPRRDENYFGGDLYIPDIQS